MNYAKHYSALIERARVREAPSDYTEKHHILPKCLGGTDHSDNLVVLTAEEHFVAHQLLTKLHPTSKGILYAAFAMGNKNNKKYAWLRKRYADKLTGVKRPEHSKALSGSNNFMYGRTHTDEVKRKLAECGKLKAGEANGMFGKTHTIEVRLKLASLMRGNRNTNGLTYPKKTCPHCGAEGGGGNMKRYHFESCKFNPATKMLKGALNV